MTGYTAGNIYSMSWYQPKYATSYVKTALRRYNGGRDFPSRVKGYCVGMRLLTNTASGTDVTFADQAGVGGVVSLAGASAFTLASTIAFGVASLAY